MTPIFSSIFSALTALTFIFSFENSQNLFSCCLPLYSIVVCKTPQFWAKATDSDNASCFSESRHPKVTKNPYYILSLEWSQKNVSAHGVVGHSAHSCRPPDRNKPFSKKT